MRAIVHRLDERGHTVTVRLLRSIELDNVWSASCLGSAASELVVHLSAVRPLPQPWLPALSEEVVSTLVQSLLESSSADSDAPPAEAEAGADGKSAAPAVPVAQQAHALLVLQVQQTLLTLLRCQLPAFAASADVTLLALLNLAQSQAGSSQHRARLKLSRGQLEADFALLTQVLGDRSLELLDGADNSAAATTGSASGRAALLAYLRGLTAPLRK